MRTKATTWATINGLNPYMGALNLLKCGRYARVGTLTNTEHAHQPYE